MQSNQLTNPSFVVLTGASGFLGKVVLEELLRRQTELNINKIFVIIRPRSNQTAAERFNKLAVSGCFEKLPPGWQKSVSVFSGDLSLPQCGLSAQDWQHLTCQTTHIIHCAASIEFDLPVQKAAEANITSSLELLKFAKASPTLRHMVSTSTAYVTPHKSGTIHETLAPLPAVLKKTASQLYADIVQENVNEATLLQLTGHPNTYTLTKCIAEHLLVEEHGSVPLSIVRPSIISAAWRYPFKGWIDSYAALAGFVTNIAGGLLRVIDANQTAYLDVVPVDAVAERIIKQCFLPVTNTDVVRIVHATAGLNNSIHIQGWVDRLTEHFTRYSLGRQPAVYYVGARNGHFRMRRLAHQLLPHAFAQLVYGLQGKHRLRRRSKNVLDRLDTINRIFPYFTNKTFDFYSSMPLEATFDVHAYIDIICHGIYQYLLRKDPSQVLLAGAKQPAATSDLLWALNKPRGNWAIRLSGALLRKALRRMFDEITFDQASFERALKAYPQTPQPHVVIVPTHRSYIDFLICSYLFFARPHLGITPPAIAAAHEFSEIFFLGWLFKQMHAFYLQRGIGKPDHQLTRKVHELVQRKQPLQFFIEGKRSRSRHFLPSRRGLLRCLQSTGESFAILPVSISYDRLVEEEAFLSQLQGKPKQTMHWGHLLRWLKNLVNGKVALGRVHVACGTPLLLDAQTDVPTLSQQVMEQLQRCSVITTYHLSAFLAANPSLPIDEAWLRQAIEMRGGRVLQSSLTWQYHQNLSPVDAAVLQRTLCNQWSYLFIDDACQLQPGNVALLHYKNENMLMQEVASKADIAKKTLYKLLTRLFEPICADYAAVAKAVKRLCGRNHTLSHEYILQHTTYLDYTTACAALRALEAHGYLHSVDNNHYAVQAQSGILGQYINHCAWQVPAATSVRQNLSSASFA